MRPRSSSPRWFVAAAVVLLLGLATPTQASAGQPGDVVPTKLRAGHMERPLGLDGQTPALSWELSAGTRGGSQSAFQIQAASTTALLLSDRPDLWDSGRVQSPVTSLAYGGKSLASRERVQWRVRVWSGDQPSAWSDGSWFETGLSQSSDWSAGWITHPDWRLAEKKPRPVVLDLPKTSGRYLRLDVTKLGLPLQEQPIDKNNRLVTTGGQRFPDLTWRLQLAEVEVRSSADPSVNLAAGRAKYVTASETETLRKTWEPGLVADGIQTSNPQESSYTGYQSAAHAGPDVSAGPIDLTIDLGASRDFDQVLIYPRTDTLTTDGHTPNFPVDYSIQSAGDAAGPFATARTVSGQQPPATWLPAALPLLAKDFRLPTAALSARLYVSGLGVYVPSLNGHRVGDAVLEPANTDYQDRVSYATYDVTSLLSQGDNTIGLALGNGTANALHTAGRYRKFARSATDPKAKAQLEVTLADGRVVRVGTDSSWLTTLGPTTSSNWYGGEDYDATRAIAKWDAPSGDRSTWTKAVEAAAPPSATAMTGRFSEPVRVLETLQGTEVSQPAQVTAGVRVFDLGRNVAAIPQITLDAPSGTVVRVYPAESLANGQVDQSISNVGTPIWDQFTSAGRQETWHPDFTYHGFRYLEVVGVPESATLSVAGLRVQTDNDSAGTFESSNDIITGIDTLTRRAVEANMMSVLTDCPSREKLGWLEESHLVFDAIARNYDVRGYARKIVQDIADGQESSGMVPSTVPDYTFLAGAYRDDPNWGGALVRLPLQMYQTYGDTETLRTYYPAMQKYLTYLQSDPTRWNAGTYEYSLGDWITVERPQMPKAVTGTFGVWAIADGLSQIATALGHTEEAATYRATADKLAVDLWTRLHDPLTDTFAGGGMGATALALDMGAVPPAERAATTQHLVDLIQAQDWHLTMGEISFPSVLRVLSKAGRDDVVYRIASQTTSPSLGYQVVKGNTALGETWDGGSGQSQNHFMLGAMDGWIRERLSGIQQAEGSVGFRRLLISPAQVDGLTHASGSYVTPYGTARTSWTRGQDDFQLDVSVPAGSTAEVHVPLLRNAQGEYRTPTPDGATLVRIDGDVAVFDVGSGDWTFRSARNSTGGTPS